MRLVITGALGHIGSRLTRHLGESLGAGTEIILIDNLLTQRYPSLFNLPEPARYRFHELDVSKDSLENCFEGADVVIHLAAITDAASSFDNSEEVERNNLEATRKVARACLESNSRMIHLSSTSVYGTQEETVDEFCSDAELQPQSPYAKCKLNEEKLLQEMGQQHSLDFVVCRFGTICGVSPGIRFHTAVNKFCWQAVMNKPITVWRTALHQKRPYLSLDDAVSAIEFIVKENVFDGQIYNVLTDNKTVNEIIESIQQHIGNLEVSFVDTQIMNQLSYEVLNARFRKLGFHYNGSIDQAIAETIALLAPARSLG